MPVLVSPEQQQRWLAAYKRGKDDGVHVWLAKDGWHARSRGSESVYTLLACEVTEGEVILSCSCPGAGHGLVCKHVAMLAAKLHSDGRTVRLS